MLHNSPAVPATSPMYMERHGGWRAQDSHFPRPTAAASCRGILKVVDPAEALPLSLIIGRDMGSNGLVDFTFRQK